jgi:WD40 repeat protein
VTSGASRAAVHVTSLPERVRAATAVPTGRSFALAGGQTLLTVDSQSATVRSASVCPVDALASSPNGDRLAAGCVGGRIVVLDAHSLQVRTTLQTDSPGYGELAWSPDSRLLAAGHREPLVTVFDTASGDIVRRIDPNVFDDEGRTAVAFSPDGSVLATTAYNGVFLWPSSAVLASSERLRHERRLAVRGHAHVIDLEFSADGETLAGLSEAEGRSAVHLWRTATGRRLERIPLPRTSIRIAWAHKTDVLAVAEIGGRGVSLWQASPGRSVGALEGANEQDITALAASGDGSTVVAGTYTGDVLLWCSITTEGRHDRQAAHR